MEFLPAIFFFVLGGIVGSFLNVVILRYHTGMTLGGRSRCMSCGRAIAWYDLVPVVSFFALRGRCRFCKSKLSWQYPLVELSTAFLFLGVFLKYFPLHFQLSTFNFQLFLLDLAVMSLLVVIAAYDLKHKIIPDPMAYAFMGLSFLRLVLLVPLSAFFHLPGVLDFLAGPLLALPLFLLWFFSKGRWIGLGDAKLSFGIGWFLTFLPAVSAEVIGFWIGAIVGLFLIALSKWVRAPLIRHIFSRFHLSPLTLTSEVPLAPFLIAGFLIVYFWNFDVTGLSALFFS